MKNIDGVYIPQYDPSDSIIGERRMGHMATRTVIQLAQGSTAEQFQRMCDAGLSTVDGIGRDIHGKELYNEFSQYCQEDQDCGDISKE